MSFEACWAGDVPHPEPSASSGSGIPYGPRGAIRVLSDVPKNTEKNTATYFKPSRATENCGNSLTRKSTL